MAPAPIAWTSTLPWLRMTPAMAPATATGLEVADTLRTSTGGLPSPINCWNPPSDVFSVDALDRCRPPGRPPNRNQYRIECHRSLCDLEPVRESRQEALDDHVPIHPDDAVAGADPADVG